MAETPGHFHHYDLKPRLGDIKLRRSQDSKVANGGSDAEFSSDVTAKDGGAKLERELKKRRGNKSGMTMGGNVGFSSYL